MVYLLNRQALAAAGVDQQTIEALARTKKSAEQSVDTLDAIARAPVVMLGRNDALPQGRTLSADEGLGMNDGGAGAALRLYLENTGVDADTYGSASKLVAFTVDQKGRITAVEAFDLVSDNVAEGDTNLFFTDERARDALSGGTGIDYNSATGEIALADTEVEPDTYGSATQIPVLIIDQQGRIADADVADIPPLDAGHWTPTLTAVANIDTLTALEGHWQRVGNVVTGSVLVGMKTVATGVAQFGISLPVTSDFALVADAAGCGSDTSVAQSGGVTADVANNRLNFAWVSATTADRNLSISFSYRVRAL